MPKDKQKGVSLVITFFILTILLAVVLSTSIILYSEIKTIRNIGNSVGAFYVAASGVEKSLYYDRKGGGFCNICTACPSTGGSDSALNCLCSPMPSGSDCNPNTCTNCHITYQTIFPDASKNYEVNIITLPEATILYGTINSKGVNKNVIRAIESRSQIIR